MYDAPVNEARLEPMLETKQSERSSRFEALRDYELNITFLNRGCIVRVGCKSIAFENVDKAMEEISNYVKNPHESREKWWAIFDGN